MVADVTVVGTGIIALAAALELADRGASVRLVGTTHAGNASSAAGGMLAPSVHPASGRAHEFAVASLARYPGFVAALAARTGLAIPLNDRGILELAESEADAARMMAELPAGSRWIGVEELAVEEPALSCVFGAALHVGNRCVEPLPLMDALRTAIASHERISAVREDACEVRATDLSCHVLTDLESRLSSDWLVLAAGAWTPLIGGSGAAVGAVQPLRGQMIAFEAAFALRHVVCGASGYLIPRSDGTIVAGGTMEHAGFEATTTREGIDSIRSAAIRLVPALEHTPVHSAWAGLRPATPDLMPIIGPDPERPRLVHACGHSRNGILLAPLTAEVVADIITGTPSRYDIPEFVPGRH